MDAGSCCRRTSWGWVCAVQLEGLAVVIRPRNPWEAIDLGFGMARQWWRQLYLPWLCLMLPLFGALNLLFSGIPWVAPLIIWWLKPFYDRILLHVLSRAVFGHVPGTRETLRRIPGLLFTGLFAHLTWLRFDFIRTFRLPVMQLEELRGKAGRGRVRILQQRVRRNAVWLLLVCMHLEGFLYFGIVAFADIVVPNETGLNIWDLSYSDEIGWTAVSFNFLAMLPLLLVEPVYAAGGFALYLNRRTELEGWDIELKFREMAARLAKAAGAGIAAVLLAVPVLFSLSPRTAFAEQAVYEHRLPPAEASAAIKEVLAQEIFGTVTMETVWRPKDDIEEPEVDLDAPNLGWLSSFAEGLATLFEIMLWAAGAVLLYLFMKHAVRWYLKYRLEARPQDPPSVVRISGMVIDPETLPTDIPAAVRTLWRQGRPREAVSLLYRGALLTVVRQGLSQLPESATEGDVLRLAKSLLDERRFDFLSAVTGTWRDLAYAHRAPGDDRIEELCDAWPSPKGNTE